LKTLETPEVYSTPPGTSNSRLDVLPDAKEAFLLARVKVRVLYFRRAERETDITGATKWET